MLKVTLTGDGSATLYDSLLDATYHSMHGAVTESRHVFIRAGLEAVLRGSHIRILEIGFGTGLNALLTMLRAATSAGDVEYHAMDHHQLPWHVITELNYPAYLDTPGAGEILYTLHHTVSGAWAEFPKMRFQRHQCDIHEAVFPDSINLVYFDAFGPATQPEMWQPAILQRLYGSMTSEALLVTYCAQGQFKRDLRACGFEVAVLPGPPGKREMVRATKS